VRCDEVTDTPITEYGFEEVAVTESVAKEAAETIAEEMIKIACSPLLTLSVGGHLSVKNGV